MHESDISPLTRVVDRLGRATTGDTASGVLPSGFPSLDRSLGGGFRRGDLIVVGGDDSAGTSALLLAIALRLHTRGLLLSTELHAERVYERALAMSARVPLDSLRLGVVSEEERTRLAAAALMLRNQAPVVETLTEGGVAPVERAFDATPAVSVVLVDALEGLLDRPEAHAEALAYTVLGLKRLALRRDVVVVLGAHLPALGRDRLDRRPRLTDFGLGGAIGAHADIVLGLYRDELYEADLGVSGAAELLVLKHREGPRGYVDLYFDSRYGRFEDVLEE